MESKVSGINKGESLLRLKEVMARTGLSKTRLYGMIKAGTFPANIPIGPRTTAWIESEVQDWIELQIVTAKAKAKKGGK
jgi:prophage regulatory protein